MLPRLALRNPVGVLMASLAVLMLGATSARKMPVDLFPDVPVPVIIIYTQYPGATPGVVEQSVTYPIERAVSQASNLWYTDSLSRYGLSTVAVWFRWGSDVDSAQLEVAELVKTVRDVLPPGTWQPVAMRFDISRLPLATIAMEGTVQDDRALYDLAFNVIAPQIAGLPGIARGRPLGGVTREVVVEVDPERMRSRGISVVDVDRAIRDAHVVVPAGTIEVGEFEYQAFTNSLFRDRHSMNDVVVRTRDGVPIRVGEVGQVIDGGQVRVKAARVNGRQSVYIDVLKVPGANTIDSVGALRAALPALKGVPPDVKLSLCFDQAVYVENALRSLTGEVVMGGILALVVILLFLGTLKGTLIVSTALPLSMAAALIVLLFSGQSLNLFTLGGLALSVGILVDDAIVALENVYRRHEGGLPRLEASLRGTQEVALPILSATLTTCIIFLPLVFLTGISRYLFIPLAFSATAAIAASYLVSMTVVPAMTRRLLPRERAAKGFAARFGATLRHAFGRIDGAYERLLRGALRRRGLVIVAMLALFGASLLLVPKLGTEFYPETDEGQFGLRVRLPVGSRVEETNRVVERMERAIMEIIPKPDRRTILANCGTVTGFGGSLVPWNTGPQSCYLRIELSQSHQRARGVASYQNEVRDRLQRDFPGIRVGLRPGGLVADVLTFGTTAPIDVEIRGFELAAMRDAQEKVMQAMRGTRGVADVFVNREYDYPQVNVMVNRELAAAVGVSVQETAAAVRTSLFGNYSRPPVFFDPQTGNPYFVITRLAEPFRQHVDDLKEIYVMKGGKPIPVRTIAEVARTSGPPQFDRRAQQRVIDVLANPVGRDLGSIAAELEKKLATLELQPGVSVHLRGQTEEQRSSFEGMLWASLLALALVYMVLAAQYKSLLHPLITMFTVPLGFAGVFVMLYVTGTTISTTSLMGMIMMVGIVVRNGVLLIAYTNELRDQGMPLMDATLLACRTRLRPILMTAIATVLGLVPMALAMGVGSEPNAPLARAVIGGLVVSTALTLFFVPALYTLVESRLGHRRGLSEHERRRLY